jgi:hypothetical protein
MATNAGIVRDSKIETTGIKHERGDIASKSIASTHVNPVRRLGDTRNDSELNVIQ